MSNIIWQDPPRIEKGFDRSKEIDAVAAELKMRPGQWALVATDLASPNRVTYKKRGLEVRTSSVGKTNGKSDIYARWPEGEPAS